MGDHAFGLAQWRTLVTLAEVVSPQQKLGRNELREDEIQGVEKASVAQAFQLSCDRCEREGTGSNWTEMWD